MSTLNTNTKNTLENISYEDIENKLMLILLTYPDKTYTKSELYNILLDKFEANNLYISPQFKYKYMIVLNQLPSKHEIKVTKNLITSNEELDNNLLQSKENILQTTDNVLETKDNVLSTMEDVSEYIIENNLLDIGNYEELPFDLVSGNKLVTVEKMLENENLMFFRKPNKDNKTPLKYIKSKEMMNLFLEKVYLKVVKLERENLELFDEIKQLRNDIKNNDEKINYVYDMNNNITIYEFICKKIDRFLDNNSTNIQYILTIGIIIFLLRSKIETIKLILLINLFLICFGFIYNKIFSK